MHHRVDSIGRKPLIADAGEPPNSQLHHIRKPRTDYPKRQEEYQRHNPHKGRNRRIFSREHLVDLLAPDALPALPGMYHGLPAQCGNKLEPHIR